jgi:cytochrome P450
MHLDDIDLSDLDRFQSGFPHDVFTFLRNEAPVWWHEPTEHTPDNEGFWVLSRYADAKALLSNARTFSSNTGPGREGGGTTLLDYAEGQGPGEMLSMSDPPQHTRLRRLVSKGFTPRMIRLVEDGLRKRTTDILDDMAERTECDFLVDVAAELPLQATCEFMGIPLERRYDLFKWTNALVDHGEGADYGITEAATEAAMDAYAFAQDLMDGKRENPADDITTALVQAEFVEEDGEIHKLTEDELNMFFMLLITAGTETTRNAIASGLQALIENPSQVAKLRDASGEVTKPAVEEILRWTSPVNYNRRTVTEDVEINGQAIEAGQKITHWYPSLNRDEAKFASPFALDLARTPNEHIAFGHGIHVCLGASLARLEIKLMFEEMFKRFTDFEMAGQVEWARTNKFSALRHMPIRYRVLS